MRRDAERNGNSERATANDGKGESSANERAHAIFVCMNVYENDEAKTEGAEKEEG